MSGTEVYDGNNSLLVKLVGKNGIRNTSLIYMKAVDRAIRKIDLAKINREVAKDHSVADQHEGGISTLIIYPINDTIEL